MKAVRRANRHEPFAFYFDAFSFGRSSGGASKTTVGMGTDGVEVDADEDDTPSATEASLAVEDDAADLTESLRCRLLEREPEPLLEDKR